MLCVYNLNNVKNTHEVVLLLVKLQVQPATLLKVTLLHGCFSRFLNCKMVPNCAKHHICSESLQHLAWNKPKANLFYYIAIREKRGEENMKFLTSITFPLSNKFCLNILFSLHTLTTFCCASCSAGVSAEQPVNEIILVEESELRPTSPLMKLAS